MRGGGYRWKGEREREGKGLVLDSVLSFKKGGKDILNSSFG